jgi:phenylalanyl-tRNA synthetase beta chain
MKLSEQWLRQWVDPALTTDELAEQLTMAGFEVEGIESCAASFKNIIVARVEQVEPHPKADKLKICQVNTGSGLTSIVCGADNVAADKCFPLALPGATLPDGRKIKETVLKGLNSAGMLCSGDELGLSSDAEQLFELDSDAEPGLDLADYLALDDHIIELSLTPNRGDCISLAGIAREVGVLNDLSVNVPEKKTTKVSIEQSRSVSLKAAEACPRYAGRVINGIDITKRAPDWILERLRRADIRSINAVVDLTNYVMLELGQPMHAFDNDKLSGEIVVRLSKEGEELTLLDGQHYQLQENTLLITDDSGPIAMGGIMGGLDTAVSDETRNLFLESAYFDPEAIAGRARAYGLHTDASHRYERGVDFELQEPALERLTELLIEYCGGSAGPLVMAVEPEHIPVRATVTLEMNTLSRVLGVDIEEERVKKILQQLDLGVEDTKTGFEVSVPSFRFDISIEADLIEEVARVYGYNNMPSAAPRVGMQMHGVNGNSSLEELQQCLLTRAYHEVITYSFVDKSLQEKVLGEIDSIPLLNPISSDLGVMRCSLLPGLISTLAYNQNRQQERIRLFECGRVFRTRGKVEQELMIGGIISGNILPKQWDNPYISSDIYDLKSDIEALVQMGTGAVDTEYRPFQHPALHSGQSAQIFIENQPIGIIGALHPLLLKEFGLTQGAYVFELQLSEISAKKPVKFAKISKFPVVKRDISLLVEQKIPVHDIINRIESESIELLSNLELFDLYQGEGIDLGKKSLALGLTFQRSSSTLTEEEVESVMVRILRALNSEFGATLRE